MESQLLEIGDGLLNGSKIDLIAAIDNENLVKVLRQRITALIHTHQACTMVLLDVRAYNLGKIYRSGRIKSCSRVVEAKKSLNGEL